MIDEDGCYDPADFNDGLLLGLKGTLAQAELHPLARASKGVSSTRRSAVSCAFRCRSDCVMETKTALLLTRTLKVRGAVHLVFRLFQETGSAYGVMQRFAKLGLRFPKRAYGGVWAGRLVWGQLTHSRILGVLKNPS